MITLAAIGFFLKRVFFFVIDNWKVFAMLGAVIVVIVIFNKACNKPPKLDEKQIQKAEQAVKERNDAALKEILAESDVVEKQIDANVANASTQTVNAINESKKKYENMTTDELAAEIERRK